METLTSSTSSSPLPRRWSDFNHDLLLSIFSRLSIVDLILGSSAVCSSWRAAAKDPNCWRVIDLSDWDAISSRITIPITFSKVLKHVLGFVRESERIAEVYFPMVADTQDLLLVSQRLPKLLFLSFPSSERHPGDIAAYAALTNFKSLKGLSVDSNFFPNTTVVNYPSKLLDLPMTICKPYPESWIVKLPDLFSMGNGLILMHPDSWEHLEHVEISGCKMSRLDERVIERASSLKVFFWHGVQT